MSNNQINTFPYISIFTHIQVHAYHLLKVTPISHTNSKSKQDAANQNKTQDRQRVPKTGWFYHPDSAPKGGNAAERLKV